MKEELIKRLKEKIAFGKKYKEDMDAASWVYEEGAIISLNEAKLIVEALQQHTTSKTEK